MLVAIILVIVGAKKILKPKATAQATADRRARDALSFDD